jgi:aspartyl-tRNA(Asn)/glutamyl-tRNA(Gln) amidotransferase subunit B
MSKIETIWMPEKRNSQGHIVLSAGWGYREVDEVDGDDMLKSLFEEIEVNFNESNKHNIEYDIRFAKAAANWLSGPIASYLNEFKVDIDLFPIPAGILRELIAIVEFTDLVDFTNAKTKVFPELLKNTGETVWEIIERLRLLERADSNEVEDMINSVLAKYPDKIEEYKKGKIGLLSLFMGEVMKLGKGKLKPTEVTELLKNKLQ